MTKEYLVRTFELLVVTFLGGAIPALVASGELSKASVTGGVSAGVGAVYALLAKRLGDKTRPTVSK